MTDLSGHTVFDSLSRTDAVLERSVRLPSGLSAALWSRNEIGHTHYVEPVHHTLSLYVSGGEGFRLRDGCDHQPSLGAGSVCVMPKGVSTDWEVRGAVSLFHLYILPAAFDRAVIETLDRDPARLELRPLVYVREPLLEGMIRASVLGLEWNEPAERVRCPTRRRRCLRRSWPVSAPWIDRAVRHRLYDIAAACRERRFVACRH